MSKLGKGSYGSVKAVDGKAVKKFHDLCALVQEYCAGRYLKNVPHVLQVLGADFGQLKSEMKLYSTSLRKWMESQTNPDMDVKMSLFKDIVKGLVQIHGRGLVHGDIKPGNIMVDESGDGGKPCAYIGDLGFVSLAEYAKVKRTAEVYRDHEIKQSPAHDIYSLGILAFELFTFKRYSSRPSYHEIAALINKWIKDRKLCSLLLNMVAQKHEERPSAADIMKYFFNDDSSDSQVVSVAEYPSFTCNVSGRKDKKIRDYMKRISAKLKIKRPKRGYKALMCFLSKNNINPDKYSLYAACTLMILSSLFGKSGFREDDVLAALSSKKCSIDEVLTALKELCDDQNYVTIMFLP